MEHRRGPEAVLFDLGGVLLPFDRERRVRAVVEALAISEAAARRALSPERFARLDLGLCDQREFAAVFSVAAARDVSPDEARALILSVFEAPNLELWRLAMRLKARLTVGALSDNPAFVRRMFPEKDVLEPVFLSAEIGACKPSARLFAAVEGALGLPPSALLLIDDTAANCVAARARGWDAIAYVDPVSLASSLEERGLPT
ncbi:MAG TPA: HAD-IA family hydrolase [Caulobacteraceae bacterium]|nr:HAD-IA family hydrolase [Caulobacteraceae bacterium]